MSAASLARRILAVAAGFLAVAVLSTVTDQVLHAAGVYPPGGRTMSDELFALALAYRVVFTVLGGWITARLAPERPMTHAMVLAGIGLVAAIAGASYALAHPELGPAWYPWSLVVTAVPCVWLGARVAIARHANPARPAGA